MEIIKLENYPDICDTIDFEIKEDKLIYVNFSLNGSNVFKSLKNILTETNISELQNISFNDINEQYVPVIKELLKGINITLNKAQIKNQITKFKRKSL